MHQNDTTDKHKYTKITKHFLIKALVFLQWIIFIYIQYTIKQWETINFSSASRTHKAKAVP